MYFGQGIHANLEQAKNLIEGTVKQNAQLLALPNNFFVPGPGEKGMMLLRTLRGGLPCTAPGIG